MLQNLQQCQRDLAALRVTQEDLQEQHAAKDRRRKEVDAEADVLRRENARMREELEELKGSYSWRIARDEAKFQQGIQEKEAACEAWLKTKKVDISNYSQTLGIMRHIFKSNKAKFEEETERRKQEFVRAKAKFAEEANRLRAEVQSGKAALEEEKRELVETFNQMLDDKKQHRRDVESKVSGLEQKLMEGRTKVQRLRSERDAVLGKEAELRQKLLEVNSSRTAILGTGKTAKEEALEQELRKMRNLAHARNSDEADSLKRELDHYARFVIDLLRKNDEKSRTAQASLPVIST